VVPGGNESATRYADDVPATYTMLGPRDAPAIVLIHATRLSRGLWHAQLQGLSGAFRVIALDLPGHGALRDRPFVWDDALATIAQVVDEAAGGRAIVGGLSLGGYLAMDLAIRHPERVAGLVISGSSAEPRGLLMPASIRVLARVMEATSTARLEQLNREWFRRRYPAPMANAILAGGFAFGGGADALRQLTGRAFRGRLGAYPGPTLILNGQFDPPFRLGAGGFAAAATDARIVTIRGATHLVNLDRPSAYSAALGRFAAEVTRRSR
jgi:pimeloyl-ACP methyl ester carboxylesterase